MRVTHVLKAALVALSLLLDACDPDPGFACPEGDDVLPGERERFGDLLLSGCDSDTACRHEGEEVLPDERVAGTRVGDLLEPFFGEFQGTLRWETGEQTGLTFAVPYEEGAPYKLSNVWECDARQVHYHSRTHITTDDGAFDSDVFMSVGRKLPNGGEDRDTITSFSAFSDFQWQPSLGAKLGVNLERYSSSYLLFELDWPVTETAPRAGLIRLRGTLAVDPEIRDTIQVATLTFEQRE